MRKIEFIVNEDLIDSVIGLHIHRSMDDMFGSFAIEIDDEYSDKLQMDYEVKIKLNGKQIINGYIDKIWDRNTRTSQSITVFGTDKTGDLSDCPYESLNREFKNQSVASIIKKICSPFGITVSIGASASSLQSTILPTYVASMGIPAGQLISELLRDFGYVAPPMGDGKLTITAAGITKATDSLEFGKNILFSEAIHSNEKRYKDNYVRGYGVSTDNKGMTDYTEPEGKAIDSVITRYRPNIQFFENIADKAKCNRRAQYERQIRAGLSRTPLYYVGDWDQTDASIWDINTLVTPNDDKHGFKDEMILNTVDYYLNDDMEEGKVEPYATIKLVHKATYATSGTIKGIYDA